MLRARHAHKHDCASASSETLTRCFAAEPPGGGTRCRMAGQLITHEIGRPVQSDFWPAVGALDNIRTVLFRCRSRWTKHKTTRESGRSGRGRGADGHSYSIAHEGYTCPHKRKRRINEMVCPISGFTKALVLIVHAALLKASSVCGKIIKNYCSLRKAECTILNCKYEIL